jgi:hypothetical protein
MDRVRNDGIRDRLRVAPIGEKACPTSIEVVCSYPKETFRGTDALWSPKSRYQCEERERKTEADMGGGNKQRF